MQTSPCIFAFQACTEKKNLREALIKSSMLHKSGEKPTSRLFSWLSAHTNCHFWVTQKHWDIQIFLVLLLWIIIGSECILLVCYKGEDEGQPHRTKNCWSLRMTSVDWLHPPPSSYPQQTPTSRLLLPTKFSQLTSCLCSMSSFRFFFSPLLFSPFWLFRKVISNNYRKSFGNARKITMDRIPGKRKK